MISFYVILFAMINFFTLRISPHAGDSKDINIIESTPYKVHTRENIQEKEKKRKGFRKGKKGGKSIGQAFEPAPTGLRCSSVTMAAATATFLSPLQFQSSVSSQSPRQADWIRTCSNMFAKVSMGERFENVCSFAHFFFPRDIF